jgi:PhnB protein
MHARLTVGEKMLMVSDAPPDRYEAMKGFMVTLGIGDPSEVERLFYVLSKNGTVQSRFRRPSGLVDLACSSSNSAHRG